MSQNERRLRFALGATGILLTSLCVFGQELEVAGSPEPVGSGARAAGMADAFVAIADDATAASWNPAGLVQLERPEVSLVWSYNGMWETFSASYHPEIDTTHDVQNSELNYLSLAYPVPITVLGRNACISINYQRKYDFSRNLTLKYDHSGVVRQAPLNSFLTLDFEQSGGLGAITPAFAIELTHRISVGMALNLWRSSIVGENGWEQTTRIRTSSFLGISPSLGETVTKEHYKDFHGTNETLGVLWSLSDRWSLGVRYDSEFTGAASYTQRGYKYTSQLPSADLPYLAIPFVEGKKRSERREIHFPSSLALGVAFRPNDRFTVSSDLTRTDWNDFYFRGASKMRFSLVDASNLDAVANTSHFKPALTARLGFEYVFIPKEPEETLNRLWTARWGVFYDQEPAHGHPHHWYNTSNGRPDDFYGATAGVGLLANQRVNIDLAYQLRYGSNVNSDFIRGIRGFNESVFQQQVLLSTVIYFR